jgi:hypothetical protein
MNQVIILCLLAMLGGYLSTCLLENTPTTEDPFNLVGESFPQGRRKLTNPYSVNYRTIFYLKGRKKKGWLNLIAPFRGLLVMGSPGSGKTRYIIRPLISQQIQKGYTLFVYDFKYDDLSRLAWHSLEQEAKAFAVKPRFHLIHFEDLSRSSRCNPLDPAYLKDMEDATEASRTILLGLNRDWIHKQGDFFVESAINFFTALIWFLRRYKDGKYCTLPHVIELMQAPYDELFTVLRTEEDIAFLLSPFLSAYMQNVMPQLEGQVAGAKIALARLSAPSIYYVLTGNDCSLAINNPQAPVLLCVGNNPGRQQVYGALLSLYVSRVVKEVNKPGGMPCSLIFDEFPTLYFNGMDSLLATARSNRVAPTIVVQDISQLRKEYGRAQAEVLLNIPGNLISGQVSGDSARLLSERFGRILQERVTRTKGDKGSSSAISTHLDQALPASRMATLSSGEMVGILADTPDQPLKRKLFHGRIQVTEEQDLGPLPLLVHPPTEAEVNKHYWGIKKEVRLLLDELMERIMGDPLLKHLVVKKMGGSGT